MQLSTAEKKVFQILFDPSFTFDGLLNWIAGYLGGPAAEFCKRQGTTEIGLLKYIQHHIHLVSEKDLQDFLDEHNS